MRLSKILSVFIAAAVFPSLSFAQFEGAVWDTLTSDTLMDALSRQPIAATLAGFHLVYAKDRVDGAGWEVHYRFFDLYGAWDDDVMVESDLPAYSPSISAREFDAFKIAVAFDAGDDIYGAVASSPWDGWTPVNLTDSPDPDYEASVSVDDSGNVRFAWITEFGGNYKIAYGILIDGIFEPEIIEESDIGQFGLGAQPLIVTVGDVPHIFYRGVNSGNYHIHHAWKVSPDSAWNIEFLYTDNLDDYEASAVADDSFDIHLAVSGNTGWGMPGRIYYARFDFQSGQWSEFELASGSYSLVEGSIALSAEGTVFIAGSGVSGNIYTGEIYLSDNSSGHFQTEFLAYYQDGTNPHLAVSQGSTGALAMQGIIGQYDREHQEILFYGPERTSIQPECVRPDNSSIFGCYPNPFNSRAMITFSGSFEDEPLLEIYDILGRELRSLASGGEVDGRFSFIWDGHDRSGRQCPSGVYFYAIKGWEKRSVGKMILLR